MSYNQRDYYPYPDQQYGDGYGQGRGQTRQQSAEDYGQNRQHSVEDYAQNRQHPVEGYAQNRQHSLDDYGQTRPRSSLDDYGQTRPRSAVEDYGQNRQYSADGYGQGQGHRLSDDGYRQHSVDLHGQGNQQHYADGYGQKGPYPAQPGFYSDQPDLYSDQPGIFPDRRSMHSQPNYDEKLEEDPYEPADIRNTSTPFRGDVIGSPALSETKLLVSPTSLQKPRKRLTCLDYTLCRCWPRWARWICCSCLLIILGVLVAIAVLAATFKMPSISLNGVTKQDGKDEYVTTATGFSFNFALKIGVVNDNIIGATFQKIRAVAYYPIDQSETAVGGGELTNVIFPAHATTNLTFPFSIDYDPSLDNNQAILNDIISRCGLQGTPDTKKPLEVNYAVTLYLRILFVTITPPPIKQKATFDCPIHDGELPQFAQNIVPTNIVSVPTPSPT